MGESGMVDPWWFLQALAVCLALLVLLILILSWAVLEFLTPARIWGEL